MISIAKGFFVNNTLTIKNNNIYTHTHLKALVYLYYS